MNTIAQKAHQLIAAIDYDNNGSMGRGGNGGLLSPETTRATDALRLALGNAPALYTMNELTTIMGDVYARQTAEGTAPPVTGLRRFIDDVTDRMREGQP